ncbi:MAG: riboflavin biosynthesis protein RibF [Candidatus Omnitrophota bacterium]
MKTVTGISSLPAYRKAVVALGVFDGVHIAHQKILKAAVRKAFLIHGASLAVTFFPHPQKEESLCSLKHRLVLICRLGIDNCIVIRFDRKISLMTAEEFVRGILVNKIHACYVLIGRNFRFGRGADGGLGLLRRMSRRYGFKVMAFSTIKSRGEVVSSTRIRRLIKKGDLIRAQEMLLRRVSVLGTVIRGASLAKSLGFPTANINPHHEVLPPKGVYAVKVVLKKNKLRGICYIGVRPTLKAAQTTDKIDGSRQIHVEVHIFDFHGDIYGKDVEISFISKIREEKKFSCVHELSLQVKKDILSARQTLSSS